MKILVIEDHRDLAENIGDYFEPRGHVLDYAADGITGLHLAVSEPYDVVVLDLGLPGMDGITVLRQLRETAKNRTPVLVLTARDRLQDKETGFGAGADDYLVKPFSMKELELRLTALERRSRLPTDSRLLTVADLEFDPDTLQVQRAGKHINLNPTTRKMLRHLLENQHRVVTRAELEALLWNDDPPDGDVLRSHIYLLRTAIDKPFNTRLLQTIHGEGYRLSALTQDTQDA